MKKIKFKNWNCLIEVLMYGNGNIALQLIDEVDHSPVATATVNIDDDLPINQAYIKDYSENEGMLLALIEAGVVISVIEHKRQGFVDFPLCLLDLSVLKQ